MVETTAGPGLRWSRATLLASVAMVSGALAHLSAGGLMPSRAASAVLFAVCLATAGSLLGRPASTLRVVALVVAGQTFIHGALTALSGHRGDPPVSHAPATHAAATMPSGDGRRVGSLYEQVYGQAGASRSELTVPVPVQHLLADLTGAHAPMAIAHLLAAVAVGLWLARGERLLWQLLAFASHGVRELLVRILVSHYDRLAELARAGHGDVAVRLGEALWRPPGPAGLSMIARSVVRRGPPSLLAA